MNPPRLLLLLVLALGLSACSTTYTKVRVINVRGEFVSEWVARGPLKRRDGGYEANAGFEINAVERVSPPRYSLVTHYPEGRITTVLGPHILTWRCAKPEWLAEYEGNDR